MYFHMYFSPENIEFQIMKPIYFLKMPLRRCDIFYSKFMIARLRTLERYVVIISACGMTAPCLTSSIYMLVLLASGCDRRQTNLNERITRCVISLAFKHNV